MSELDLDAVLAALKPFQSAAVDHVTGVPQNSPVLESFRGGRNVVTCGVVFET